MKNEIDILIRKAKPGDEKDLGKMFKEGLKRKFFIYTGTNKNPDAKKLKKWRKQYKDPLHLRFVAIDKDTLKVIGSAGGTKLTGRKRHMADLGWMVHPDYQGKGIATKLLQKCIEESKKQGLKRLEAELAMENNASFKLAKKCGFKIEGKKIKGLLLDDGRYVDTYLVGRIL